MIIGPPIIQLLVFGYAATFDLNHVPFAVYNEDAGAAARDLLARFEGSPTFRLVAVLTQRAADRAADRSPRGAAAWCTSARASAATCARGAPGTLQLIVDGRDSNTAHDRAELRARRSSRASTTDWARRPRRRRAAGSASMPRAWFNPNLESRWFIVPGIVGLLTLVVTMLVTALSVAREREQGTFDQLLVTPLRPVEILIGKALPGFVIGLVEATRHHRARGALVRDSAARQPADAVSSASCCSCCPRSAWG